MKKLVTTIITAMIICVLFCACNLFSGKKYDVSSTDWSGTQTDYIPHETFTVTFDKNGGYVLSYHKDAVNTKEVKTSAQDLTVEGKWEFDCELKSTWKGDWNITQKATYEIIRLSDHPLCENGAYFSFEKDGNVAYISKEIPQDGNAVYNGFKVVKK